MSEFVEGNFEDKYNATNPVSRYLMQRYLRNFKSLIKNVKQQNNILAICEIGCGEGELLKILRKYFPKAKIYACDLSANEIAKAKKNCRGLNIHFSQQDAQKLPQYSDKQFDLVIACEVLEHFPHPEQAIKQIQRVGAQAIVSVPLEPLWRILYVLRLKYVLALGNTPGHLNHWSPRSFKKLLSLFFISIKSTVFPLPWQMYHLNLEANYSQEGQGILSPFLRQQRYLQASKHIHATDAVLDLGCGSGRLKEYLHPDTQYFGLDTEKCWNGNQPHLFVNKVEDPLPSVLRKKTFTFVSALAILEHLKQPIDLFVTASKVLPVGGKLVLTTPHPIGRKIHDWGAKLGLFSREASEEHEKFLDRVDMMKIAHRVGFKMIFYRRFLFGMNQIAVFQYIR